MLHGRKLVVGSILPWNNRKYLLVAEFIRGKEETALENAKGGGQGNGVEILDGQTLDDAVRMVHRDLVQIAFLGLQQKEELGLSVDAHLVQSIGGDDDAARRVFQGLSSTGDGDTELRHVLVLVSDEVLGADQDARRTVITTGH